MQFKKHYHLISFSKEPKAICTLILLAIQILYYVILYMNINQQISPALGTPLVSKGVSLSFTLCKLVTKIAGSALHAAVDNSYFKANWSIAG